MKYKYCIVLVLIQSILSVIGYRPMSYRSSNSVAALRDKFQGLSNDKDKIKDRRNVNTDFGFRTHNLKSTFNIEPKTSRLSNSRQTFTHTSVANGTQTYNSVADSTQTSTSLSGNTQTHSCVADSVQTVEIRSLTATKHDKQSDDNLDAESVTTSAPCPVSQCAHDKQPPVCTCQTPLVSGATVTASAMPETSGDTHYTCVTQASSTSKHVTAPIEVTPGVECVSQASSPPRSFTSHSVVCTPTSAISKRSQMRMCKSSPRHCRSRVERREMLGKRRHTGVVTITPEMLRADLEEENEEDVDEKDHVTSAHVEQPTFSGESFLPNRQQLDVSDLTINNYNMSGFDPSLLSNDLNHLSVTNN